MFAECLHTGGTKYKSYVLQTDILVERVRELLNAEVTVYQLSGLIMSTAVIYRSTTKVFIIFEIVMKIMKMNRANG